MKTHKFSNGSKGRLGWKRKHLLVLSILVLLIGITGGTIAYLTAVPDVGVTNTFTPGKVDIEVDEQIVNNVKKNVRIFNKIDSVSAIIRAKVIVTWQNDAGQIHPNKPAEGTDYSITWCSTGWDGPDANGWYTHNDAVAPGAYTNYLFTDCAPIAGRAPAGYFLVVDIISEAVQSTPADIW